MAWCRLNLFLRLRYGSDVIDFSFLSYHLALAKVCESFTSPIPPEFVSYLHSTRSQVERVPLNSANKGSRTGRPPGRLGSEAIARCKKPWLKLAA